MTHVRQFTSLQARIRDNEVAKRKERARAVEEKAQATKMRFFTAPSQEGRSSSEPMLRRARVRAYERVLQQNASQVGYEMALAEECYAVKCELDAAVNAGQKDQKEALEQRRKLGWLLRSRAELARRRRLDIIKRAEQSSIFAKKASRHMIALHTAKKVRDMKEYNSLRTHKPWTVGSHGRDVGVTALAKE
jgi:bifunctional DNA-binding transcriptional regulator/antitoxin component of YhaV-PrlF toxin-antitoxin module